MKRLASILVLLSAALLCTGQKINRAEYFIDTDPGIGKAVNIPITTPANDVSLNYSVNISALSHGFHMLVYRARDNMGRWSVGLRQVFYVFRAQTTTDSKIVRAEYFIDADPGFGSAVSVPIATPADKLELSFNVNISSLSEGFHMMLVRTCDNLGRWSSSFERVFYVYRSQGDAAAQISGAEYFIDADPGFGSAVTIPIATPANKLELGFNIDISSLDQGFHIIVLRTLDNAGRWSPANQQVFYVFKAFTETTANVTAIEYFLDTDPGFGKGTIYNIPAPGKKAEATFTVSLAGVTAGNHVVYFRARDASGRWGPMYSHAFTSSTTGIEDAEIRSWFRIYPNPGAGDFIINFSDTQDKPVIIAISDLNGKVLYRYALVAERTQISTDLSSGIYMVQVEAGNKTFSQKLLISR